MFVSEQLFLVNCLFSVALLDSLDSTTGTKAAASRETLKDDDLEVIPEGISHRDEGSVEDELDGHTKEYTEDHRVDTTGRLKTVTGSYISSFYITLSARGPSLDMGKFLPCIGA